jgi:quercetin dioxygenase-like cupin family protein
VKQASVNKANLFSSSKIRKINPNWFTNKVHMIEISSIINSKEQHIYHVYFADGAKTKLHIHNGNQILIVTKGRGVLETFSKKGGKKDHFGIKRTQKISLNLGDVVYIPMGTLHTHGSADKKHLFSHIAINIFPTKNKEYRTIWYESDFKTHTSDIIK